MPTRPPPGRRQDDRRAGAELLALPQGVERRPARIDDLVRAAADLGVAVHPARGAQPLAVGTAQGHQRCVEQQHLADHRLEVEQVAELERLGVGDRALVELVDLAVERACRGSRAPPTGAVPGGVQMAAHDDSVGERLEPQRHVDGIVGDESRIVDAQLTDGELGLDGALAPRAVEQFDSVQAQW